MPPEAHLPAPLLLEELTEESKAAAAAVRKIAAALPGSVRDLVAYRANAKHPLPVSASNPDLVQLVGREMALTLISMLCQSFAELIALEEVLTPLHDRRLAPAHQGLPQVSRQDLLAELPEEQLLSAAGVEYGVKDVEVGQVLAAANMGQDLRVQLRIGPNRSMQAFFWRAKAALQGHLAEGVVAPSSSGADAVAVLEGYVLGMAHVGRMLIKIHNLLLEAPPAADWAQEVPEAGPAAAAAAGPGEPAAAAPAAAPLPFQPLSDVTRQAAATALQAVAANFQGRIIDVVAARVAAGRPLRICRKQLVQLVSRQTAITHIMMYCPRFRALTKPAVAARKLYDRKFGASTGPNVTNSNPSGWPQELLPMEMPEAQLLSALGVQAALHRVSVGHLLSNFNLGSSLGQQLLQDPALRTPGGSMLDFFRRAHKALLAHLINGMVVPKDSTADARATIVAFVQGLAQVGRVMIGIHNLLLLPPPADELQAVPEGGPEAAAAGGAPAPAAAGGAGPPRAGAAADVAMPASAAAAAAGVAMPASAAAAAAGGARPAPAAVGGTGPAAAAAGGARPASAAAAAAGVATPALAAAAATAGVGTGPAHAAAAAAAPGIGAGAAAAGGAGAGPATAGEGLPGRQRAGLTSAQQQQQRLRQHMQQQLRQLEQRQQLWQLQRQRLQQQQRPQQQQEALNELLRQQHRQ